MVEWMSKTYLSLDERIEVATLAREVETADGVFPLNDGAEQLIARTAPKEPISQAGVHVLARADDKLVGYGCLLENSSAVIFVAPWYRRRSVGRRLLAALEEGSSAIGVWAFADLGEGREFARAEGLVPTRKLMVMDLGLEGRTPTACPPSLRITTFDEDDLEELVRINSRAFVAHPDQSSWGVDQFAAMMAQNWFDPQGVFIARTSPDSAMVGFAVTKIDEGIAVVHILGVDPHHSGQGIGRALLEAGLAHLSQAGMLWARLWVDASNTRARDLYLRFGFSAHRVDVQYRRG